MMNGLVLLLRIVRISDSALGLDSEIRGCRMYHKVVRYARLYDVVPNVGILYKTERPHL